MFGGPSLAVPKIKTTYMIKSGSSARRYRLDQDAAPADQINYWFVAWI